MTKTAILLVSTEKLQLEFMIKTKYEKNYKEDSQKISAISLDLLWFFLISSTSLKFFIYIQMH